MELQASRLRARLGPGGAPILLADQNRERWDQLLIGRGLDGPGARRGLAPAARPVHAPGRDRRMSRTRAIHRGTDWVQIVALYDALAALNPSPIVELNRAVAVSMAYGPAEALVIVDELVVEAGSTQYHLLPAVRADLLARLGRRDRGACRASPRGEHDAQ